MTLADFPICIRAVVDWLATSRGITRADLCVEWPDPKLRVTLIRGDRYAQVDFTARIEALGPDHAGAIVRVDLDAIAAKYLGDRPPPRLP